MHSAYYHIQSGHPLCKWGRIEPQLRNYSIVVSNNGIALMCCALHSMEIPWENNEMGTARFHWKPLGNNGMEDSGAPISFIQSTITYMKLHIWNYIYEMNNVIGNEIAPPFHWKPLGNNEMGTSWTRLHFIENPEENNEMGWFENPNFIPSIHHYIYEITYMKWIMKWIM